MLSVPTVRKNPINLMNVATQVPSITSGRATHSVLHIVVHNISHTTVVLCSTLHMLEQLGVVRFLSHVQCQSKKKINKSYNVVPFTHIFTAELCLHECLSVNNC